MGQAWGRNPHPIPSREKEKGRRQGDGPLASPKPGKGYAVGLQARDESPSVQYPVLQCHLRGSAGLWQWLDDLSTAVGVIFPHEEQRVFIPASGILSNPSSPTALLQLGAPPSSGSSAPSPPSFTRPLLPPLTIKQQQEPSCSLKTTWESPGASIQRGWLASFILHTTLGTNRSAKFVATS